MLRLSQDQFAALVKRQKGPPRPLAAPPVDSGPKNEGYCEKPVLGVLAARPSKYRSRATGGYASVKEARRAAQLKLLVASGAIRGLREQVPYHLIPAQRSPKGEFLERGVVYFADFVYEERHDDLWEEIVEDTKGYKKGQAYAMFVLKRKLMLWRHGVRIRET